MVTWMIVVLSDNFYHPWSLDKHWKREKEGFDMILQAGLLIKWSTFSVENISIRQCLEQKSGMCIS
jgi:hypothetical protein